MQVNWIDDPLAEHDLTAMNIRFTRKTLRLSQIDLKESSYNGARLGDPLVRRLIDDYKVCMCNGNPFFRPVVYKGSSGWILASGNQRTNAVKELANERALPKDPEVGVYVMDTADKLLIEAFARAGNVPLGGRAEVEERKAHAIYCVKSLGMRVADAARLFAIAVTTIQGAIRAEEVRKALAKEGVDVSGVPLTTLADMAALDKQPDILLKVGQLSAQHLPKGEKVKQVVSAIAKEKTQPARMAIVKRFEKELSADAARANGNGKASGRPLKAVGRPRRDNFIRKLRSLADFLDLDLDGGGFTTLQELQVASDTDEMEIGNLWKRIQLRMNMILKVRK